MGKDPAFLFYSSDFLTGTMLMSDGQVGKYTRLLCLQHQKGHLTKNDMLKVCGGYDGDIFRKFTQDKQGLYYNERLETEIDKRKAHSQKQRENAQKRWDKNGIYNGNATALPLENENVSANEDTEDKRGCGGEKEKRETPWGVEKGFVPPATEEVKAYCRERNNGIDAEAFVAHYRSNGWKVGNTPMEDWKAAVTTWERRKAEQTRASPEAPEQYKF